MRILLATLLFGGIAQAQQMQCVGLPLERHGYADYIHSEDKAKVKLKGVRLNPDWSPHIMDDPITRRIPPDWCDRAKKAFQDHRTLPKLKRKVP